MSILKKVEKVITLRKEIKNWKTFVLDNLKVVRGIITYETRNGTKILTRAGTDDASIIGEIFVQKVYTPEGMNINEEDVIIDIGAHIGIFSLYANEKAKKGKIYSFEPEPRNFQLLHRNKELNCADNIALEQKAVSNKKGKKRLKLSKNLTGGNSLGRINSQESIKVETTTLPEIMKKNKIKTVDLLKIDCEGEETKIMYSLPKNLLNKIKKITMEYHYNDDLMKEFLEKNGYSVWQAKETSTLYAKKK